MLLAGSLGERQQSVRIFLRAAAGATLMDQLSWDLELGVTEANPDQSSRYFTADSHTHTLFS